MPNSQVLDMLAKVILGRSEVHIGSQLKDVQIDDDVRQRQQSGAPEWLMLLDQIAQKRAANSNDFSTYNNLCLTCGKENKELDKRVAPKRYIEALHIATRIEG